MTKITQEIYNLVKETCKKKTNYYSYRAWTHHILSVFKYSKILSKKLKADKEICELAALLHDYASVKDKKLYPEHHIHSAKLTEKILKKYNYPKDRIEKIKHCILSHRASRNIRKETLEAKILADADSMAHLNEVGSLFHLAFVVHKLDVDEAIDFVLKKLERDWKRLSPQAKEIMKEKYKSIKNVLCHKI